MTPDQEAKMRAALERKMAEMTATSPAPAAVAPVVATPTAPAPAPTPVVAAPAPALPVPATPPPVPASTKTGFERLAELTDLYMANQITPAQYHQERAVIIQSLNR